MTKLNQAITEEHKYIPGIYALIEEAKKGAIDLIDESTLPCALLYRHLGVINRLLEANPPITSDALNCALIFNHINTVKKLIDLGALPNEHTLNCALAQGNNSLIQLVIGMGAETISTKDYTIEESKNFIVKKYTKQTINYVEKKEEFNEVSTFSEEESFSKKIKSTSRFFQQSENLDDFCSELSKKSIDFNTDSDSSSDEEEIKSKYDSNDYSESDSFLDDNFDPFVFHTTESRAKHPSEIEFIEQIQADKNDLLIEAAVKRVFLAFKNKEINGEDIGSVLAVLVRKRKGNILRNIVSEAKKDFIKYNLSGELEFLNDLLLDLLIYSLQKDRKECSKILLDLILDGIIEVNDREELQENISSKEIYYLIIKNQEHELLDRLLTDFSDLAKKAIPVDLICDIKSYSILKNHHVEIDINIFSYDVSLSEMDDDLLVIILTDDKVGKEIKEQLPYKFKSLLRDLIFYDKVKSVSKLIEIFKDDSEIKILEIIDILISENPPLMRSIDMYELLLNASGQERTGFFYEEFLPELCMKYLGSFNPPSLVDEKLMHLLERQVEGKKANNLLSKLHSSMPSLSTLILSAIGYKLSNTINLFLGAGLYLLDEDNLDKVFLICVLKNNKKAFEQLLINLSEGHKSLLKFATKYISIGLKSDYLELLIQYRGTELVTDKKIKRAILRTNSPQIAQLFIQANLIEFPREKLEKLSQIAAQQEDEETFKFIQKKMGIDITPAFSEKPIMGDQSLSPDKSAEKILTDFYGTGIPQSQFEIYSKQIAGLICHSITNKQFSLSINPDSKKLSPSSLTLYHLGEMRQHIAELTGSEDYSEFGQVRDRLGMVTPHLGRYQSYFADFLMNIIPAYEGQSCLKMGGYIISDGDSGVKATIIGTINEKQIPLTRYDFVNKQSFWIHADPCYLKRILSHVDSLIKQVTQNPINTANPHEIEQIIPSIATIHWWLSQATPFYRGSAAVTEWIIMGLCQYHGLAIDWKKDSVKLLPDCWALTSPNPEKFAKKYTQFSNIRVIENQALKSDVKNSLPIKREKSILSSSNLFTEQKIDVRTSPEGDKTKNEFK